MKRHQQDAVLGPLHFDVRELVFVFCEWHVLHVGLTSPNVLVVIFDAMAGKSFFANYALGNLLGNSPAAALQSPQG
jgi:hypothetical protein